MHTETLSALPNAQSEQVQGLAQSSLHNWLTTQLGALSFVHISVQELDALFTQARAHGVLALLGHWSQTQTTLLDHANHMQSVRAEHARTALLDALHYAALAELSHTFARSAIRGLVIKGAALARSHYPSPGLRPRVDTDLLIEPHQIARAHEILLAANWQPVASNFSAVVLPERTYQKRFSGAVISLDVHWGLSARPLLTRALPFEALYTSSIAFDGLEHWRMPCGADALMIAVVHRIGHHRDQERFIWLYDVHLLWQAMTPMQQEQMLGRAEQTKLCAILLEALVASQALFHTEISPAQLTRLQSIKNEPSGVLLNEKLSDFAFDWRFASWRERYGLVKQRVWAEPGYLRTRFKAKRTPIGWLQVRRWFATIND